MYKVGTLFRRVGKYEILENIEKIIFYNNVYLWTDSDRDNMLSMHKKNKEKWNELAKKIISEFNAWNLNETELKLILSDLSSFYSDKTIKELFEILSEFDYYLKWIIDNEINKL